MVMPAASLTLALEVISAIAIFTTPAIAGILGLLPWAVPVAVHGRFLIKASKIKKK